jgi:4-hydroxybenzoate polyprenyltransferase
MKNALQLIRPLNTFFTAVITGTFCYLTGRGISLAIPILAGISAGMVAAGGNIINDIMDINSDRINKPLRVLASGKMTAGSAFLFYYACVTISIILSLQLSVPAFAVVVLTNVLLLFYAQKLRRNAWLKNVTIAGIGGLMFLYAGIVSGNIRAALFPALFAFLSTFLREIMKDITDVEGDKVSGYDSFPISFGIPTAIRIAQTSGLLLIASCIAAYYLNALNIYFFLIAMLVVCPVAFYIMVALQRFSGKPDMVKLTRLAKAMMFAGFLAILAGL